MRERNKRKKILNPNSPPLKTQAIIVTQSSSCEYWSQFGHKFWKKNPLKLLFFSKERASIDMWRETLKLKDKMSFKVGMFLFGQMHEDIGTKTCVPLVQIWFSFIPLNLTYASCFRIYYFLAPLPLYFVC